MPRKRQLCLGGLACHVMNRATARDTIFADAADYIAFERVLAEARERDEGRVRVCSYVLLPNHFHLVLWPRPDEDAAVSRLMKWLTLTHAQRWHAHRRTAGTGALYGAWFRSFPLKADWHFLNVCRYVERNPLRAGLVNRAEEWPWCSLAKRLETTWPAKPDLAFREGPLPKPPPSAADLLDGWPVPEPADWIKRVNQPETAAELEALRRCVRRGRPFGDEPWAIRTAERLGLTASLRPTGRPKKQTADG